MRQNPRPLYFPSGSRTLFGWLHAGHGATPSDMGVVICKPFGYEAICAHESIRAFADTCVAAGMDTLRFDYSGTGDSSDTAGEGDEMSEWCEDICAAIDALQRAGGARRICLLGVRLGALLGGLVAARRRIDCQIAVAPVTSGRRYVRELRAFQATAASAATEADARTDAGLQVAGFRLSGKAVETLKGIELIEVAASPDTSVLILDRSDLPDARRWADKLEGSGADVHYAALPGYLEMVSTPHASVIPLVMIEALKDWLTTRAVSAAAAAGGVTKATIPPGARMRIRSKSGVDLTERATFIDSDRTLFGIVTERVEAIVEATSNAHAVILLNCGATNHIGPNRLSVDLARKWAAKGYVVLRLDITGLGDSGGHSGDLRNHVYPPGALFDIGRAVEFLRRRRGVRKITMAGVCSGAYHSLRSAIAGLPVNRVLLINPLTFYWRQGDSLDDLQISEVVRNPGVYLENALSLKRWQKLLRGRVNLWRVVKVFVHRAWLAVDGTARDVCRRLGIRIVDDLGWDLASVAERGVRMVFIFARGDGGLELLRNQGGSMVNKLGEQCRIHVIDGADHIFSQEGARAKLVDLLDAELAG
jgi:alpha-beta hydrolase superfamily lysophospholipase